MDSHQVEGQRRWVAVAWPRAAETAHGTAIHSAMTTHQPPRSAEIEVLINEVEQFTDYDSGLTPLAPIFPPEQRDDSEVAQAKRIFLASAQDLVHRARNPSTQHTLVAAADALVAKFELALVTLQNEYEYEELRLYAGAIAACAWRSKK
jgi:hypothetical protein